VGSAGGQKIQRVGRRGSTLAVATILITGLTACEPTPDFPDAETPLVGVILAEKSVVISGGQQQLGFLFAESWQQYLITVTAPAGAYPVGTRLTIRVLGSLATYTDTSLALNRFVGVGGGGYQALQVLPARLAPAVPLHVDLIGAGHPWSFDLLHASEGDLVWTAVDSLNATPPFLSFDIPGPGLWTLGQLPLPPWLQGRLQRTELDCNDKATAAPPRFLDVSRALYTWASPGVSGCYLAESGVIESTRGEDCVEFISATGYTREACYVVDPSETGVTWTWDGSARGEQCALVGGAERERYVLLPLGPQPPPLPLAVDAGCPAEANGSGPDGGTDGRQD
jgi:hypothetical protein